MFNVSYDIAAIGIYIFIFVASILRKTYKSSTGYSFIALTLMCFLSTVFDIFSVTSSIGEVPLQICNILYLITRNLSMVLYMIYIISYADLVDVVLKKKACIVLSALPFVITFITVVTNPITGKVFTVENGIYERGPLMFILYASSIIYMIISFSIIMKYRKMFDKVKITAFCAIFPLTLFSLLVQFVHDGLLIELLAQSFGLLFLMIVIERPEENIDLSTGLLRYDKFILDGKRAEITKKPATLCFLYMLHFGSLKSIYSYETMRRIRKTIAGVINGICKEYSLKCSIYYLNEGRFGIATSYDKQKDLIAIANVLHHKLNGDVAFDDTTIHLNCNCFIVNCPEDVNTSQKCFGCLENTGLSDKKHEDVVLYKDYKNTIDFEILNDIDQILEDAVINKKFEVYYQPIYSLKTKKFSSCEALLRLNSDKFGYISPAIFIPVAEKNGMIYRIGNIVVEEVCKFISSNEFKKLSLEYVEINLSVVQCMHKKLTKDIEDILSKYNVDPSKINFEITETSDGYSHSQMLDNVTMLKKTGFDFSLDDYGTGYSNIERIQSLPLKLIKFDRSFVLSAETGKMKTIISDSVSMMKHLNLQIVVEGVETKEMVDYFESLDCDYIQGFYFSKPIPKKEFIRFVTDRNR